MSPPVINMAVVQVAGCTGSETSVRSTPCCYTCKPKPAIVRLRETTHDFEIHTLQAFAPAAPLSCSICSTLFRASLFSSSRGLQRCKRSTSISKLTAVCTVLHVRSRSRPRNAGACLNNVKQALRQGRRQDVVISVCVFRAVVVLEVTMTSDLLRIHLLRLCRFVVFYCSPPSQAFSLARRLTLQPMRAWQCHVHPVGRSVGYSVPAAFSL